MIKETSLLYYPDYRGTNTPYDEYIFDDEKGKIGYYFEITLSNGLHEKFPNTEVLLTFKIQSGDDPVYITNFSFHCSKDFKPGEVRFQPYYQKHKINRTIYAKQFLNNDYPYDIAYLNDLIFTKESKGSLLIQGELVEPNKTKRKPAKEETVYDLITPDKPQLIPGYGTFSIGIRITNHWDVKFNNKYHNKLYMLNDDCDGFIWEKYHEPDDYILVFCEWYSSSYWHNKGMILYPNDKYAIPLGLNEIGENTNRSGKTKDFFVRGYYYAFYDIGGHWYTTKNGKDWVSCKEELRAGNSYSNWTPNDNKGVFTNKGHFYTAEIEDDGQIHFHDVGSIGDKNILGDGLGYIYYTDGKDPKPFKTVFAINSDGSVHETCLNTSSYTLSSFGTWNDKGYISGSFKDPELKGQRFLGVSTDGFSSMQTYTSLSGGIPNYGDQLKWHSWGDDVYWSCRRREEISPNVYKYYYDIGNLGSGSAFASYEAGTIDTYIELCGMSSSNAASAYYKDYKVSGNYLEAGIYVPSSPSINLALYFKDGKPSYPFGHMLRTWEAWNNVLFLLVIGECDRHDTQSKDGETPPWDGTSGSFAYDFTNNYMIDPDNETWVYPWV